MSIPFTEPVEFRSHSIYRYTDQIYKVIQFYRDTPRRGPGPGENQQHYDKKLDSSISRTKRMILEKALCNPWDWFCTFTIDEGKHDRKNLDAWREGFTQWMRDQRKKGFPIRYLLVPEMHQDGSWHAHGLLAGLPDSELEAFRDMDARGYRTPAGRRLPRRLRESDYMNWTAYMNKFGFCSFGAIQSPVASGFYITKYITKDNSRTVQKVGLNTYYCSKGLNVAEKHLDFWGRDPEIDRLLVNKYDFCATGMTHVKDNCNWSFGMEFVDPKDLEVLDLSYGEDKDDPALVEAAGYYDFEQCTLEDLDAWYLLHL